MRRLGLIRPQDLVPSRSLGGPPAAGRQRVFVEASGGVVACSLDNVWSLAVAGVQGTEACSRLSPPVPGPRGGRGHTCRTPPRACSVSNATSPSANARLARSRRTQRNRGCATCVVGRFCALGAAVQRRRHKCSAVTGASFAGRAVTEGNRTRRRRASLNSFRT